MSRWTTVTNSSEAPLTLRRVGRRIKHEQFILSSPLINLFNLVTFMKIARQ